MTEDLASASARRPWVVVGLWVALLLIGGLFASRIGDALTTEFVLTNDPEYARGEDMLERVRGPKQAREFIIVSSPDSTVDDPQYRSFVDGLLTDVRGLEGTVSRATSFYETDDPRLVSEDGRRTLLPVFIAGEFGEAAENVGPLVDLVEEADGRRGFRVLTAGSGSIQQTMNEISEEDLQRGELIALPVALVILLLVFGTGVAAGIPLVLAVMAIVAAVGTTALIGQAFEMNFLIVNMITMIGLAVGIDYSLFIVHRYREERRRGLPQHDAIVRAGATASRAVLFSGSTVIVALLGLFIVPTNIYRSLALGAMVVAAFAVLAALTLLPATLSILGDRVDALRLPLIHRRRPPEDEGGFWGKAAGVVMRYPVISAVAAVALLLAAAGPFFTIETGLEGAASLPEDTRSRQAFEILERDFSAGLLAPAEIVIDAPDVGAPAVQQGIERLRGRLSGDEMFGPATVETDEAQDLAVVSTLVTADPESDRAREAVERLRGEHIPEAFAGVESEVLVTGDSAQRVDLFAVIGFYEPIVFAFVLGLSFVLLLLVFRSVVVPLKAIVMNLLSVGAAYGLLVVVFQHGVGNELVGFQQTDSVEVWLPLFLFAFLFGLSMDYHVFLLSRIRERFDQTGDNAGSVGFGVRSTAGIITGAALIMVAVFSGFASGDLASLQQSGFGLAVAVALDATIIRSVLVPASMELLGDWNWYLPRWLRWLPDLRVEAGAHVPTPVAGADGREAEDEAPAGGARR